MPFKLCDNILRLLFNIGYAMKEIKITLFSLCFMFLGAALLGQNTLRQSFDWSETPKVLEVGDLKWERWSFPEASFNERTPSLPYFHHRFFVNGPGALKVQVINVSYEPFSRNPSPDDDQIGERLNFTVSVERDRNRYKGKVSFVPIVKRGSSYERVISIELAFVHTPSPTFSYRGPQPTSSVLNNGQVFKMAVNEEGIQKLSYDYLKDELKVNVDQIDPRTIQIFGNRGGHLPLYVETDRPADLTENRILVSGEADGSFDQGDYVLFYGEGPNIWSFDEENQVFNRQQHVYDENNYYFLVVGASNGLRVEERNSIQGANFSVTTFNDFARFEEEEVNLFKVWDKTTGSNRDWFGDYFKNARERDYPNLFSFPNMVANSIATVQARMAVRSPVSSTYFLDINGSTQNTDGQDIKSEAIRGTTITSGSSFYFNNYVNFGLLNHRVLVEQDQLDLRLRFPQPTGASETEGWLDYIQVNAEREMIMMGDQMRFQNFASIGQTSSQFSLRQANGNLLIWDISNPLKPIGQKYDLNGSALSFGANTEVLTSFVAFNPGSGLLTPKAIGAIPNQNLHSLGTSDVDMLIVYHPEFVDAAEKLAKHRREFSKLTVETVSVDEVYNEFSSGKKDPAAIRDLARMVYDRTAAFKYLLLFGDGSFDARDIYELGTNFVPVYQTNSFRPLDAFPSDDFYGVLNGTNPADPLSGDMNIAVGRIPVKTVRESANVVNKIIDYDLDPEAFTDWRNRLAFVADDEDGSTHTRDADGIARLVTSNHPQFNVDKLYLDAFPQENTPAGPRVPDVNSSIDRSVFRGVLAVTYLGHGGPKGWAQERVLNIVDIKKWVNKQRLPLFITATCTFTSYDDAEFVSAGEETFLNPTGGVVALLTTTRAVFASENEKLTRLVVDNMLKRTDVPQTVGDIMVQSKNDYLGNAKNSQKFTLIGDPATVIAKPRYDVRTTQINGKDVADATQDTLRAFDKVTIAGQVVDNNGNLLSDFNGTVFPTVFDKTVNFQTLGQDSDSPIVEFDIQKNTLFKGKATVKNGLFEFTFVVPKDINFKFGLGKISYYASDPTQMIDAAGHYQKVVIGGASDNLLADNEGPQVDVFMNNLDFVFGGITDENPTLLVTLEDENGINVVGNSIGHDLEAVLDDDTQNTYLLNDFYEAKQDDYTQGEVRFPLAGLEEGLHSLQVRAWDVANNPAEGYTEFVVATTAEIALKHVLNYPNPFSDRTCFQFDHNLAGQEMDVLIQIYTVSGRLVKTLEQTVISDQGLRLDNCIEWDGRDDFGDQLARGVYLYKVGVRASSQNGLSGESDFQKLVLLK